MCLVTKQRKAKIAKKDIVCYKVLDSRLRTTYQYFMYIIGRLYATPLKYSWNKNWCAHDVRVIDAYWDDVEKSFANEVYEGFHAALKLNRLRTEASGGCGIYEFRIPAGSEYFTDKTGLIVSNQIMLVNDVNLYKP